MANKKAGDNGIATRYKSGNEAVIAGRKGGKASGQSRRQFASFREAFKDSMTDEDRERIFQALKKKAMEGDVRAAEFLRDTMGEKPTDKVEQTSNEYVYRIEGMSESEALRIMV